MKRLIGSLTLVLMAAACSSGPPAPPPPPPFTPAGVFDVSLNAMGQQISGTMTIEELNGAYTGSITSDFGSSALTDFVVDGMAVTFSGSFSQFAIAFDLTYEDDGFAGQISIGGMGSGPITGVKR